MLGHITDPAADGGLARRDLPEPQPGPHDVVVEVRAYAVNRGELALLSQRPDGWCPGQDVAGVVRQAATDGGGPALGTRVVGLADQGGWSERVAVPSHRVAALPDAVAFPQAAALPVAGLTALRALRTGGPLLGRRVLVTGASGGVGSTAVAMLAGRGYRVAASTGSPETHDYLRELGAQDILDRGETSATAERPLERERWAGALDAVGGSTLAYLLRTTATGGSIALSGNVGGAAVSTTVFPFILRGVSVLGIDSVHVPLAERTTLWQRMAQDLRPRLLDESITREVSLAETPRALEDIYRGATRGRVVVRVSP
jgi:putative YhdH/YhfP family quinone oxidoreductase